LTSSRPGFIATIEAFTSALSCCIAGCFSSMFLTIILVADVNLLYMASIPLRLVFSMYYPMRVLNLLRSHVGMFGTGPFGAVSSWRTSLSSLQFKACQTFDPWDASDPYSRWRQFSFEPMLRCRASRAMFTPGCKLRYTPLGTWSATGASLARKTGLLRVEVPTIFAALIAGLLSDRLWCWRSQARSGPLL